MTTIRNASRKVQAARLHPSAPARQPVRIFGAGILPQTRAERLVESSRRLAVLQREHEAEARVAGVTKGDIDRQWKLGFDLGRDGLEAAPDQVLTFFERKAFRDGWDAGMSEFCEGLALDAAEKSGIDWTAVEDAELAEARMSRPEVYCFN